MHANYIRPAAAAAEENGLRSQMGAACPAAASAPVRFSHWLTDWHRRRCLPQPPTVLQSHSSALTPTTETHLASHGRSYRRSVVFHRATFSVCHFSAWIVRRPRRRRRMLPMTISNNANKEDKSNQTTSKGKAGSRVNPKTVEVILKSVCTHSPSRRCIVTNS